MSQWKQPAGVWPVMLTPFNGDGSIDWGALGALIGWYEQNGAAGLFAVCQSSEMFFLSLPERVELAAFVKKRARVPVIASGHVSESPDAQADELRRVAGAGVDAVVLVSNRLCAAGEEAGVWKNNLARLLDRLDPSLPLGFYECPYPHKRLLSADELAFCAGTGRFLFLKDTCCDGETIRARLAALSGRPMRLFNANTATLLESLRDGAAGFSGVMANFHPELYAWLCANWRQEPEKAEKLQHFLTLCALIERQCYPVNAKVHLGAAGLPVAAVCRVRDHREMTPVFRNEVAQMAKAVAYFKETLGIG